MPPPHQFTSEEEYKVAVAMHRQILCHPEEANFALTGVIPPHELDVAAIALYVTSQNEKNKGALARYSLPLSEGDINEVYEAGLPSSHGKGNETVYDPTYRQAHELKPPDFALSVDLVDAAKVLTSLPVTLGLEDEQLSVRLHKLNIYGTGGFFKPHRDTPRGDDHMGTLTFCLPSAFTGGELVIRQDGNEIKVDWSSQVMDSNGIGAIGWCFLYADCEHELLPVKSGMQVTLAYDVFYAEIPETTMGDTRVNAMLALLAKVFDPRNNFFPSGAKLGFGLRHEYAGNQGWVQMDKLENRLKGIDRTLMSVIKECQLEWKTRAVYRPDDIKSVDDIDTRNRQRYNERQKDAMTYYKLEGTKIDEDGYEDLEVVELSRQSWNFYDDVMLADNPMLLEGATDVENAYETLYQTGAIVQPEVVWIVKPSVFESRNGYVAYGNQSNAAYSYSACALIVTLPKLNERYIPSGLERFMGQDAEVKSAVEEEDDQAMRVEA